METSGDLPVQEKALGNISFSRLENLLKIDLSAYSHTLISLINFLVIIGLIVLGFVIKEDEVFTAENGVGYALGIIGGTMMLLLVIYPIRKKLKTAPYLGSVRFWFKTHMVFGVLGPVTVLYHANFSTGSLNSTIALICMIIVAGSGFFGRYFYSKIHYGLYGRKASFADLSKTIEDEQGKLAVLYQIAPELKADLSKFQDALKVNLTLLQSLKRFVVLGTRVRLARLILPFRVSKALKVYASQNAWSNVQTHRYLKMLNLYIKHYLGMTLKVIEFSVYERLFALWHVLHLPMFFMMIVTAIVHILAVHMY